MISPSSRRNRPGSRPACARRARRGTAAQSTRLRHSVSAVFSTEARDRQYTMPESPSCSPRTSPSSWRAGSALGSIRYWMFGRSKLATKCRAPARPSRLTISSLVALVAVAVSAIRGTAGKRVCSPRAPGSRAGNRDPTGDAVRLVDREQRDPAAVEQPQRGLGVQPLRRQVQQVELAGQEVRLHPAPRPGVLGGVQEARPEPEPRSARPPGLSSARSAAR